MKRGYTKRIRFVLTASTRLEKGCTVRTSRGGTRLVLTQNNRILVHLPKGLLEAVEQDKIDRDSVEKLLTELALTSYRNQAGRPCLALRMLPQGTFRWETIKDQGLAYNYAGELREGRAELVSPSSDTWERVTGEGIFVHTSLPPHEVPLEVRLQVYARDDNKCVRCGTTEGLSLDHILSRSRGGTDDMSNLQTMCQPCNQDKGADA